MKRIRTVPILSNHSLRTIAKQSLISVKRISINFYKFLLVSVLILSSVPSILLKVDRKF
ncbi:MAG: hypothetical protein AB1349_07430 [Elusimicrobiota bacterium]